MSPRVVVLVGHGAPATDCPPDIVARLKRLESERRRGRTPMTSEEEQLDQRVRGWPRTDVTDPYRAGVESLGRRLADALGEAARVIVAYNEFCAPSLEEAVRGAIEAGAPAITVVPTMLTPGGVHSEVEIPETLDVLRTSHPGVPIVYAWPVDETSLAALLAVHVSRF